MTESEQLKQFITTIVDLHRDNFIQLLTNPEFQDNDIAKKEKAVRYVTELFKHEIEENIDSFAKRLR